MYVSQVKDFPSIFMQVASDLTMELATQEKGVVGAIGGAFLFKHPAGMGMGFVAGSGGYFLNHANRIYKAENKLNKYLHNHSIYVGQEGLDYAISDKKEQ